MDIDDSRGGVWKGGKKKGRRLMDERNANWVKALHVYTKVLHLPSQY